jgi:hypothetical protein
MLAWNGTAWTSISSAAAIFRFKFIAAGGETSVSGADASSQTLSYIAGKEQVYLNGVLLVRTTDYTATNGTSITALSALVANDILEIITFTALSVVTDIPQSVVDAKGDLVIGTAADTVGRLAVGTDGQVLTADSTAGTGLAYTTPVTASSTTTFTNKTLTSPALTTPTISTYTTSGDIVYGTGSGALSRLGIGSTSQVLTVASGVPSWATPSAGGMTLISTTTISNNATVSLTSIPATYNNLFVVIRNYKPATAFVGLQIRFNSDATSNRHKAVTDDDGNYGSSLSFNATSAALSAFNDTTAATGLITVNVSDYTNATSMKIGNFKTITNSDVSGEFYYRSGSAVYNQTGAITSLDFFSASGNLTSGTILLYGVK